MPRSWTARQRRAQSGRMQQYWKRVKAIRQIEKIPLTKARGFYSRGLFRGIAADVAKIVSERYEARRDASGRLYVVRIGRDGKTRRVAPTAVAKSLASTTYEEMVRRLQIHTGWKRAEVRYYLSAYPQWREGVSPLVRGFERGEDNDDDL